jgi:hypothetical protein
LAKKNLSPVEIPSTGEAPAAIGENKQLGQQVIKVEHVLFGKAYLAPNKEQA